MMKENMKKTTIYLEPKLKTKLEIITESEKLSDENITRDTILNNLLDEIIDSKYKEALKHLNEL